MQFGFFILLFFNSIKTSHQTQENQEESTPILNLTSDKDYTNSRKEDTKCPTVSLDSQINRVIAKLFNLYNLLQKNKVHMALPLELLEEEAEGEYTDKEKVTKEENRQEGLYATKDEIKESEMEPAKSKNNFSTNFNKGFWLGFLTGVCTYKLYREFFLNSRKNRI